MNRIVLAAILATSGFAAVATAQTAPPPPANPDAMDRAITRDESLAMADRRFDRMDANQDGKIDKTEMVARRQPAAAGAMPPLSPPPADGAAPPPPPIRDGSRMLARADANGDGMIDRAEFRAQAAQRFDRIDANKDGKLDADERQAARDAMGFRGGRGGPGGDMPPPPAPLTPDAGQ